MARQRMLHPDFFTDPKVVRCSPFARMLFQGLWCHADREGRIEADPFALKMRILPGDECSVPALLKELVDARLVLPYTIDGADYLWVKGFTKRQRPHPKEPPSSLPPPPADIISKPLEKLPAVEKHGETVAEQDFSQAKPSESFPSESFPSESFPSESFPSESFPSSPSVTDSRDVAPPPPKQPPIAFVVAPPTTPPAEWTADDFWRWAQGKRQEAGLLAEKWPHPQGLSSWWSAARGSCNVARLQEAFYAFGEDKYWQRKKPPLPWGGFVDQWAKYVPREVPHAHA